MGKARKHQTPNKKTTKMKSFKDLGITTTIKTFTGEKIGLHKILNKLITVHKFRIEPSKHNKGECLHMQIQIGDTKRVVFTGATYLIDSIRQVPESEFPFTTTIIQEDDRRYEFT